MHRELKIIGDRIEFYGYHVGNLTDIAPDTVKTEFKDMLEGPRPMMFYRSASIHDDKIIKRKIRK